MCAYVYIHMHGYIVLQKHEYLYIFSYISAYTHTHTEREMLTTSKSGKDAWEIFVVFNVYIRKEERLRANESNIHF